MDYNKFTHKSGPNAGKEATEIRLSVGKAGCFQTVEVYHQSKGTTPPVQEQSAPTQTVNHPLPQFIPGVTVGMSINCAIKILVEGGEFNPDTLEQDLVLLGSKIIRAAQTLERGETLVKAKETPSASLPETKPESQDDSDVQY